jgi:hypothetical protein
MADLARWVIGELGLTRTLFNIEMMFDASTGRVAIVEVNPRMCGQFADLYRKVDGTSGYELALALCTGETPRWERGRGEFAAAASFPLRVFEPMRVLAAPTEADVAEAEAHFPGARIWSECAAGERLADFEFDEDGGSHRYAVIDLGGSSRDDLGLRRAEVESRLGYRLRPLAGEGG